MSMVEPHTVELAQKTFRDVTDCMSAIALLRRTDILEINQMSSISQTLSSSFFRTITTQALPQLKTTPSRVDYMWGGDTGWS